MTEQEMQMLVNILDTKFDEKLKPINDRLQSLEQGQKSLEQDILNLKNGQEKLQIDVAGLKDGQEKLQSDVAGLKEGQTKIEVTIENQIDRAIKSIAEGHTDLYRKLEENNALENRVETLEHKMSAV